jgi:hypothetical protein
MIHLDPARSSMKRFLPALLLCAASACDSPEPRSAESPATGPPVAEPTPITVTAAEFAGLRWLEGRWVGHGPDGKPFFEGYRVADDSTIVTYGYPDAASTTPGDSSTIALRAGVVTTGEGGRYVLTELSDGHAQFSPRGPARNSFDWDRTSPNAWVATLRWPDNSDGSAREVVYQMRRLP